MRLLLERHIEVNSKGLFGRSLLSLAAEKGQYVKLLLSWHDIKVNRKDLAGQAPLSQGAEKGHDAVVRPLLERQDVEVNLEDG